MTGYDIPVIIVGAGPVGLNLALFLDRLGVRSMVLDSEKNSRWHPKGSTHNSRTMEHYRWLGISDLIRSTGLPAEFPRDVAYFTSGVSWELARFRLPSEQERSRGEALTPALHQVPEPLLRSNQMYVERCLREHASTRENITLKFGWEVTEISESEMTVAAVSKDDGRVSRWRASYIVGCDGANSFTRRLIGVSYEGRSPDREAFLDGAMVSSYVKIPGFAATLEKSKRAWMYNIVSPRTRLILISLDGGDEYLIMSKGRRTGYVPDANEVISSVRKAIGEEATVSVIRSLPWSGGVALIADRFAKGRILLCGDSCHLFSPTGGYGMNCGVDDARNLSWKLAACLQGWAPPELLTTYEIERKPVARRNTQAALFLTQRTSSIRVPENLEERSDEGEASRRAFGAALTGLRTQFTSLGVELGARYDGSPIVFGGETPPPDTWEEYRPSSVPGGRLPHLWLPDTNRAAEDNLPPRRRVSIYDVLGTGFTLLRVGETAPSGNEFSLAARKRSIPFNIINLPRKPAIDLYERSLVLVRPDHHIAWRGDHLNQSAEQIFERCLAWSVH